MSRYRRVKIEGGMSFFTLALADRGNDLLVRHIERLRSAYAGIQRRLPFTTVAICILPDHIHALWQMPDGDADYVSRWSLFKSAFSRGLAPAPARSASKIMKREKGIPQFKNDRTFIILAEKVRIMATLSQFPRPHSKQRAKNLLVGSERWRPQPDAPPCPMLSPA